MTLFFFEYFIQVIGFNLQLCYWDLSYVLSTTYSHPRRTHCEIEEEICGKWVLHCATSPCFVADKAATIDIVKGQIFGIKKVITQEDAIEDFRKGSTNN